ncbi:MAG: hypothetical protein C5S48_05690 [Candidatus Methanogaster sp.]|nr:MAG: hypothetical protein C5S48_05690 [ANME-2 cluster archaeon]
MRARLDLCLMFCHLDFYGWNVEDLPLPVVIRFDIFESCVARCIDLQRALLCDPVLPQVPVCDQHASPVRRFYCCSATPVLLVRGVFLNPSLEGGLLLFLLFLFS